MITSAKLLFFRELSSPQAENLPIFNVLKGITRFQRGENKGRELCADILGLGSSTSEAASRFPALCFSTIIDYSASISSRPKPVILQISMVS